MVWARRVESGENATAPTGGLVASSERASAPSFAFHSCVKWSVPPMPSHAPSGLAATLYAAHRPVGAASSPDATSHTRTAGAAVLASRSGVPGITAIACFPFGFGPATSLPSRTSQTWMTRSRPAVASLVPSALNAMQRISSACPRRTCATVPAAASDHR